MTLPVGKGMFMWKCSYCEGGEPQAIADVAEQAGLTHVAIKIANAASPYNISVDLPAIIAALRAKNIQAWGWHYTYGGIYFIGNEPHYGGPSPEAEAEFGALRAIELGLDGYIIDAEREYKALDQQERAARFCERLFPILAGVMPIALSTYRFPTLHSEFPFATFRSICDLDMPQVYWAGAHNPGAQLRQCIDEYATFYRKLPLLPIGAAYSEHGWQPTTGEIEEFLQTAQAIGLSGVSFWEWWFARSKHPEFWPIVADFQWGDTPPPPPPPPATCWQTCKPLYSSVNIREGPSINAKVVSVLYKTDAAAEVIEMQVSGSDTWIRIGHKQWVAFWYNGKQYTEVYG